MPQKCPGKWFRKGISLVEAVRLFPDDPTAGEWFAAMRWPDGPQCPHCASRNVLSGAAHPCMPYRCRGCDKRFSVRTGSVMADSKLGYQVWAVAIYLLTNRAAGRLEHETAPRPGHLAEVGLASGASHPQELGAAAGPVRGPGEGCCIITISLFH